MLSVICGVRNRLENLTKALPTWLEADGVDEVVITDWNSREPIVYEHERVRIVRVTNVNYWSSPQAFNIAARFANGDIYAKLDADYRILNTCLFSKIGLEPGVFINGGGKLGPLNGFFYLYADDFWRVNGFDERLHGYGWEDTDMFWRLRRSGLRLKEFDDKQNMEHLPHKEQENKSMHVVNARVAMGHLWNSSMPKLVVQNLIQHGTNIVSCTIYPSMNWLYGV